MSPAISTIIITAAVVVLILVAMVYTNGFLNSRLAENEFTTNKQFMLTTGLQIDDIAWTMGRSQTVRYSSRYGQVTFQNDALSYSFEIYTESEGWQQVFTYQSGIILYNMPTTEYTLGDSFFERLFPSSNGSFLQKGPSAPVSHVFVVEKLPMNAGNFTRVAIAPSVRMLDSVIGQQSYIRFYLPLLTSGSSPQYSQSITLIGKTVTQYVHNVTQVRFTATFPQASQGFDSSFFNFEANSITLNSNTVPRLAPNSVVEFYVGEVAVSLGLYI